jgi:SNF2 family DNA or RNA helicase
MKLLGFQRSGVAFLVKSRRALLADPPGTGKTAQLIRTMQVLQELGENPFPALVVCPNSLKLSTWARELSTWAPELSYQVVDGNATKRRKQLDADAQVFVLNWEAVRLHSRLAGYGTISLTEKEKEPKELNQLGLRTVILDEAHKAANPTAAQTRAVWAVLHGAEFRYLASGTPIPNHVGDLWSLLHGIDEVWFPAKTKYLDYFADVSLNSFGALEVHGLKPEHRDEFFRIVDPIMRRIPKEAALPHLPPVLPVQVRHTVMTARQKKAYDEMERDMIAQLDDLLVAPNFISKFTRLKQFASAAGVTEPGVKRERQEVWENGQLVEKVIEIPVVNLRLTGPSCKVDDLVELLDEMGEDEPLVVAAVSRQLIELASDRLTKLKIPHGLITGAQSQYERDQAVQRFQNGQIRVVMLTIGAGAEGITLTRSRTMLFMQESDSEIQNQQARDRVHRIGSERHDAIRIIKQITPGTVEERQEELLTTKKIRMDEVIRDPETLAQLLGAAA